MSRPVLVSQTKADESERKVLDLLFYNICQVHIDDPDILLPKLPKPKDLQPFPSTESIVSMFWSYWQQLWLPKTV